MKALLLTVACLLVFAPSGFAQADIAGRWEVAVARSQGTQTAPLELKKDGDRFVGVFYTPQGNADVTATVKGTALRS